MPIEAKPFASLSSGLLARKGAARPAMRPQGFGQVGASLEDLGWNDMGFEPPKPSALTADDAVVELPRVHPTGLTPVQSPVHEQQAELVERLNGFDEADDVGDEVDDTAELVDAAEPVQAAELVEAAELADAEDEPASIVPQPVVEPVAKPARTLPRAPRSRAAPGSKAKAAFTLRLDPDRHLKLRLACAVDGRSAQQLVTAALDQMLERMPELDGLAAKAKRRG